MPRLTRVHQKVFASNASNNGVFGSLQAGNPQTSNDVATLQSLAAFENGWDDAIEQGDKLPPLEEFQGVQYGISYQQAYMLQEGIAEWNASTPYYKGSLTKTISGTSFKLYCSLQDNNTNHVVTNTTYWKKVMDSDDTYAFDNTVVHLSGTETISGDKTFSGSVSLNGTVSANSTVKDTIFGWCAPDYQNADETNLGNISSGHTYTATANGTLHVVANGNRARAAISFIKSDNSTLLLAQSVYPESSSTTQAVWVYAKAGQRFELTGAGSLNAFFCPVFS